MTTTGSTRRILIVDDDQDTADSLSALLRLVDPELLPSVAYGGASAVAFAARAAFDAVVLDIEMPGLDGISAAHAIRAAAGDRVPVLVALSSRIDGRDPARIAVFDHLLRKPVDIDALCRVLRAGAQRALAGATLA